MTHDLLRLTWRRTMIAMTYTRPSSPLPRIAIAMLACGTVAAGPPAARAETSPADVPQVRVDYSDLDLTREQDAVTLYRRITAAAKQVCPPTVNPSLRLAAIGRRCVSDAVSRAVRNVDSSQLAEVEEAHARRGKMG